MAPFKFIDRVYNGLAIQQYGDGSTSRDYTYIDDIVDGVVRAIDRPLGYEVINLGNGRPFLLKDFISLVERSVGKSALIEVLPEQPGDVERTCADISKARRLLGYDPKVSFEVGIQRTAEWYKKAHEQGLFDPFSEKHNLVFNFVASEGSPHSSTAHHNRHSHHRIHQLESTHYSDKLSGTCSPRGCRNLTTSSHVTGDDESDEGNTSDNTPSNGISIEEDDSDTDSSVSSRTSASVLVQTLIEPESDLELSSYVEKAPKQLKFRSDRYFHHITPSSPVATHKL